MYIFCKMCIRDSDHVLHAVDEESTRIQEVIRTHQADCVLGIGGGTITAVSYTHLVTITVSLVPSA